MSARCQKGVSEVLLWRKYQSASQASVCIGYALLLVSDTPESVYVAVSSARVKMQDERN